MVGTTLMTGATGLLGTHLSRRLAETGVGVIPIPRDVDDAARAKAIAVADSVVHLAGVTRPPAPEDFDTGNRGTTAALADAIAASGRALPVLFASSIRALEETPYGRSKRAAEAILEDLHTRTGSPVVVFRLPSFFGTWSRPDYNSVVATFCHRALHRLPIVANTPDASLELVELRTVIDAFVAANAAPATGVRYAEVGPTFRTRVGDVARMIDALGAGRSPEGDAGLVAALRRTFEAHKAHARGGARV